MNAWNQLLQTADFGLTLGRQVESTIDDDIFIHLTVLLAIEETLQIGRVSISCLTPDTEHLSTVNAKMDELVSLIRKIIDSIDETKFATFMEVRARRLQHQFSPRLN